MLCSKCHIEPRAKNQAYCRECCKVHHRDYQARKAVHGFVGVVKTDKPAEANRLLRQIKLSELEAILEPKTKLGQQRGKALTEMFALTEDLIR